MSISFILIKVAPKHVKHAYIEILQLPEISELYPISGAFDLMAIVKTSDVKKLREIVNKKIKKIKGVKDTDILKK